MDDLFDRIKSALLTVTKNVSHYEAHKKTDKYIVWAEDGQSNVKWADNQMQEQALMGTIDYFTKMEYDPNVDKIQYALNCIPLSWRLNSVQREDETGFIHYEFAWEEWI